jgi:hypothetical protein
MPARTSSDYGCLLFIPSQKPTNKTPHTHVFACHMVVIVYMDLSEAAEKIISCLISFQVPRIIIMAFQECPGTVPVWDPTII